MRWIDHTTSSIPATSACKIKLPGLTVSVPATIIFTAFHIEIDPEIIAHYQFAFVDLIAPDRDADLFWVSSLRFNNDILFFPGAVFAGAGLEGEQGT